MKVTKNTEHNSIQIDFEGQKPGAEMRTLMKAYGFWWFQKEKCWIHTLAVDGEFFEKFVEERIKPLVATPKIDVSAMSDAEKQALLAQLMGK